MKKLYASMLFFLVFVGHQLIHAQGLNPCAPNCKDLNASIIPHATGTAFHAKIYWDDIITNFPCAEPVSYAFRRAGGGPTMSGGSSDDVGNQQYFLISDACSFLDGGIEVIIQNDLGMCISRVTFKKGEPSVIGRSTTVYCNDSLVNYPEDIFIGGFKPTTFISCQGFGTEPDFAADWLRVFECTNDPFANDTLKIIYREWEVFDKDGKRAFTFDTINVLRLPPISPINTYCAEQDTIYCGIYEECVGPYFIYAEDASGGGADLDMDGSPCDTIKFIDVKDGPEGLEISAAEFDDKCGLLVEVKSWAFPDECSPQYKVEVYIKESCPGGVFSTTCMVPGVGNVLENLGPGYWRCVFWLMDLDTVPPVTACKYDKVGEGRLLAGSCFDTLDVPNLEVGDSVVLVSTGAHDCFAHTYIPPVCVYDDWSGIKQVKARIEGLGSWILMPSDSCDEITGGVCYESHQQVKLNKTADGEPYEVLYEVYDNCHNIDSVYCYILIKDLVKPVVVADKGVTVSVSGKKVWVSAEEFNEDSYDNCGINLLLARRSDWYEQVGGCVNLCDSIDYCCVSPHNDTLWIALLEPNKHKEDTTYADDVEAHYAKNLDWWCNDDTPCGSLIYNAWQYDLMKYATLKCKEHPYDVNDQYFQKHFINCYFDYQFYGPSTSSSDPDLSDFHDIDPSDKIEYCFDKFKPLPNNSGCTHLNGEELTIDDIRYEVELYERLGGGWSDEVPFGCEDACGAVTVEILAMDYWCNWSIVWTNVWVEDKTPVNIVKDVEAELEITCKTYKDRRYSFGDQSQQVSIEELVGLAKIGDRDAMDSLDIIFGGYGKAWLDPYGNFVDAYGDNVVCEIPFEDSVCECRDTSIQIRVFDEHLGYIWKDSSYRICEYQAADTIFQHGVVLVNCAGNVHCEQSIWCDFDHCGEGYIFRKFKIWQGCVDTGEYVSGHIPDTIYRHQRIWVGNNCTLDKYMFDNPQDTTLYTCGVIYDPDGSGNLAGEAHPDYTGFPKYLFDDDCRVVGVGYQDKVFKVVGGDQGCYKIIRTFYYADWCGGKPTSDEWWKDYELVIDSCIQKILIFDTVPPVCLITGPADEGGTIEVAACYYDFFVNVEVTDPCGTISYRWELKEIKDGEAAVFDFGSGDLPSDTLSNFEVSSEDLPSSEYKLAVFVTDECQNENYCEYLFKVATGKKPAPVCITSLTADLVPWDLDQDGVADTAKAVVWAVEFDRSSTGPCGEENDSLSFYIEIIQDGTDQDSFDIARVSDSLRLGCQDIGTQQVRMWVLSGSGSADFCDVLLMVTNNTGFCSEQMTDEGAISGDIENELGEKVQHVQVIAQSNQALSNIASGEEGNYQFNAPMGSIVTVTPFKNVGPLNGVTTMDLVVLLNHITNTEPLSTPYRRLSADANRDGFINSLDLLELRQLILGDIDQLPNSNSWRFVKKDYVFTSNAPEMEEAPERATFSFDIPVIEQDFIAMKVGDVDVDHVTDQEGPRGRQNLVFAVSDRWLRAGQVYRVAVRSTDFVGVVGYQYTLQLDENAGHINSVIPASSLERMDQDNYGLTYLERGMMTTSWNTISSGASLGPDETIVILEIEAKKNVKLSEVLTIGSRITGAESYTTKGSGGVALKFNHAPDLGHEVQLFQNQPNPIANFTSIDFYLPADDDIDFQVLDASGKLIKRMQGDYPAGLHTMTFLQGELPPAQVLFYVLRTKNNLITKRMITTN